jgi:uroporphyrinogen-III decarboxylase
MDMILTDNKIIERNKKKRIDFFNGKKDMSIRAVWINDYCATQVEEVSNMDNAFRSALSTYRRNYEAALEGYDNIPVITFFGDIAYMQSLAFDCPMYYQGNIVISKPKYQSIEDAFNFFHQGEAYNRGLYPTIFGYIDEFQKRYGDVMITVSDNQSPIDVFNLLFSVENAMFAINDEPELSKTILDSITTATIEINRHFEKKINNFAGFSAGNFYPFGIHLSDDDAAYLSPSIYKEFAHPYATRLSEEFGGITFHVCMKYEQNIENLASTKGIIGFDAMPDYNNVDKIISVIKGKDKFIWKVANFSWTKNADKKEDDFEYFKKYIDIAKANNVSLELMVYADNKNDSLRLAEKVKKYANGNI